MLYRLRGFEPVAELFGYERAPAATNAPPPASQAVTREAAIAWLRDLTQDGLPYQVSAAAVEASAAPPVAWRSGAAQARLQRTRRRERQRRKSR